MSLVEVLPVEPVTPTTCARARGASRGEPLERRSGSGATITAADAHAEPPTAPSTAASAASRYAGPTSTPQAPASSAPRRTARRPRSPREADEQVAGADLARVDHGALGAGGLGRARHQLAARGRGDRAAERSITPAPAASRAWSASRATVTSSNGSLRPFSNSWPCSWPLPAITTTSPGSALVDRERDRAAPVDLALGVRRRRPP